MQNTTRTVPQTALDTALYNRIEVLRGAAGRMTGAGDPGGLVNLIRKRPTRELQGYLQANIGSWSLYRAEADVTDTTLARASIDYQRYRPRGSPGVAGIFSNGEQTNLMRIS